jgi:hypothetical protein
MELFNRPAETARQEGVLLLLNHGFEMLLKAIVLEKTGRIRKAREKFNYGFEKCLSIVHQELSLLDKDETLILENLNGFRDAAAHDLVQISEGLLYGHAQSALNIFVTLLKKVFARDLSHDLPRRVLPICTIAPTDISMVVGEDMNMIAGLLGGRHRREDDAEARLRPYRVIEKNIRGMQGSSQDAPSTSRLVRGIKSGDWKAVLPMVAGLVQPSPAGIPISLHLTKRDGLPVRIDPTAPTAIAFRYVRPEDKYPYLTGELARKLGLTANKLVAFVKLLQLKGNDDYHTGLKVSATGVVNRYSEKARQVISEAVARDGSDALWQMAKQGRRLEPRDYFPDKANAQLAAQRLKDEDLPAKTS